MQIKRDLNIKASKIAELEIENTKLKRKLAQNTVKDCVKRADFIKPVPELAERVSPTKEIDRPASKKEQPKKYERKAMLFMVPGGAITKEEWNDCQNLFHKNFDSGIGNNPIEKVIATPVDYGVQYLIIYKEEVKE